MVILKLRISISCIGTPFLRANKDIKQNRKSERIWKLLQSWLPRRSPGSYCLCLETKNSIKDFSLNSLRIFRIIQKGLKRRCAAKIAHWASFSRVTWPIFRRTTRPKPLWQAWKIFKFDVDLIGCSKLKLTLIIIQIFVGICLN